MTREEQRLIESREGTDWKQWGPYLSERQWATVREDYSDHGNAWEGVIHDHSRSKSYRWGEDGIGGFSNSDQRICFSWAFWNGKDTILKERLFGLSGNEGNHGEDVKELYYYLDSAPTHSYMKMLYKYPQSEFPYKQLVEKNRTLTKKDPEYEIIDTGIFDKDEYFDIFMEYVKGTPEDFLLTAEIHNRGPREAEITVLPTIWFRNTWSSGRDKIKPQIFQVDANRMTIKHHLLGNFQVYLDGTQEELLFCENATNRLRLYGIESKEKYCKDGINDYIVDGKPTVNPQKKGTKASAHFKLKVPAGQKRTVRVRMTKEVLDNPFEQFENIFNDRKRECDEFYQKKQSKIPTEELKNVQRQSFAGLMWSKQFYYYNVNNWIHGDPGRYKPSEARKHGRNSDWKHMYNYDIISMPDKWEYPWFAAWDLAFHCIPIARIDPDFAKDQLMVLLKERYIHPNGQIPAYEWNFSDVNPPVHAWAVLRVYKIDRRMNGGKGDIDFLQRAFHKLLVNFTWWINRKDKDGSNIFEGGFLGLDNIGVFDRNHPIIENARLEQADSTSWMAMFSLNMLRISLDLSNVYPTYQDMAIKFFEHFLYIAGAMNGVDEEKVDLWDDEDNFYYDVMHVPGKEAKQMRVRSMVGLIPLFAVEILNSDVYNKLPEFREKLEFFLKEQPKLASLVSRWEEQGKGERRLLSILRGFRMKKILERMLDPEEFLSPHGIRALSKYHDKHPYQLKINGSEFKVAYLPGESDSSFFGGNSNWRGPVWFPVNYLILESMLKFYFYYGDDYKVEFPKGSGKMITLLQVVRKLTEDMMNLFLPDNRGYRPIYGDHKKFQEDPHFKDYILFYEYFNGDNGLGLGASHQTGWTGLIAEMIHRYYNTETVIKV
ncbi:MAG: glucosidase [Cyclobacteriaceae bacterium]